MSQNTPNVQPVEKGEFDGHVYFLEGGKPEVAGMLHEILKDEKGMQIVRFKRSAPVKDTNPGIHIHDVHEDSKTGHGLLEVGVQFDARSVGSAWIAVCQIVRPNVASATALRSKLIRDNVKEGSKHNCFYVMGDKNYCPPTRPEKIEPAQASVDPDNVLAATLAMPKPKELSKKEQKQLEAAAPLADPKDDDQVLDGTDGTPPENGEELEGSSETQSPKPSPIQSTQPLPRKEDTGMKGLGRKPKPNERERIENADKKILSYAFLREPGNENKLAVALRLIINSSTDWAVARREINKVFYPGAEEVPEVAAFKALIVKLQGPDYEYLKVNDTRNVLTDKGIEFMKKYGKVQTDPPKISFEKQLELGKIARDPYGRLLKKFQNPETAAVLKLLEHFSVSPRAAKKAIDSFLFPADIVPDDELFDLFIELAKNSYGLLQKEPGAFIASPVGRIVLRQQEKNLPSELKKRLASLLVTEVVVHGVVANPKDGPAKKAPPTFVPFPPAQTPASSSAPTTNQGVKPMPPTKPTPPTPAPKPAPVVVDKKPEESSPPSTPPPALSDKSSDQPVVNNKPPENPAPAPSDAPDNQAVTLPAGEPSSDGKAPGEPANGGPMDSEQDAAAAASDSSPGDSEGVDGDNEENQNTRGTISFRGPYRDVLNPGEENETMLAKILYLFIGTSCVSKFARAEVKTKLDEVRQVRKIPKDGQYKRFIKSLIAFGYLERDSKYIYIAGVHGIELLKKYPNQKVEEGKEDAPKVTLPVKAKRVPVSASIYGGLQDLNRRHLLAEVLKIFHETHNTEEAQKLIDPIVLPSLTETPSRKTFGCFVTKFVEEGWLKKIKQGVYSLTSSAEVIVAKEFGPTLKAPIQPPSNSKDTAPLVPEQTSVSVPGKMSRGDILRLAAEYADHEDRMNIIVGQIGQTTIDSLLAEFE
ncbi:MAG: hypothetical protein WCF94_03800 [bacterium]